MGMLVQDAARSLGGLDDVDLHHLTIPIGVRYHPVCNRNPLVISAHDPAAQREIDQAIEAGIHCRFSRGSIVRRPHPIYAQDQESNP